MEITRSLSEQITSYVVTVLIAFAILGLITRLIRWRYLKKKSRAAGDTFLAGGVILFAWSTFDSYNASLGFHKFEWDMGTGLVALIVWYVIDFQADRRRLKQSAPPE